MFSGWVPRCRNSKTKRKGCCEDVTFTELLEFVVGEVEKGNPLDPHLTPMHEHCHPCTNSYNFVGRMENFTKDANHVFQELNSRILSNISFGDFQKESKIFAVKDYVHRLFRHKVWINRCLPMYDSMLRTWKALQIRGILDNRVQLPFSRQEAEHVSRFSFMNAALNALEKSTDPVQIRKAKSEAVVEAFSSVPRDLLLKIKELVRPDCLLFGYKLEPSEIFESGKQLKSRKKYFVSLDEKEYKKYFGGDPSKLPSARLNALSGMMHI
ncbi:hypothetical protein FSP39_024828 [Pinctada imbricata]|uniref:Carbohydrate sulfotransferase n=1 Tax=Pinctada imbricata TaxID=66713 RepID=A0AA89BMK3_PINIB|nr:hypothetical protein FSP39_024828 [Pinctada imbricata]